MVLPIRAGKTPIHTLVLLKANALKGFKLDRLPQTGERGHILKERLKAKLIEHKHYIDQNGQDMPEVRDWKWSPSMTAAAT